MRESIGGTISFTVILVAWEIVGRSLPVYFLPPPSLIAVTAYQMILSGELARNLMASLQLYVFGYLLGIGTAILIGLLIGRIKKAELILGPLIDIFRPLPGLGVYPLAILLFGIGFASQVAVIWWGVFFAMVINVVEGCRNVDPILVRAGQSLDANRLQTFIHIVLPSVFPYVIVGLVLSCGYAFHGLVAAEMVGATVGIGFLVIFWATFYRPEISFVGLFAIMILAIIIDRIVNTVAEKTLLKYREAGYKV